MNSTLRNIAETKFTQFVQENKLQLFKDPKKGVRERRLSGTCSGCGKKFTKSYGQLCKKGCFCTSCINKEVFKIRSIAGKIRQQQRLEEEQNNGTFICPKCKKELPNKDNTRLNQKRRLCRGCRKQRFDNNLDSFLHNLVRHARYRTAIRNNTGRDHRFDIDTEYLTNLWKLQDENCAISGVQMKLLATSDWQCSVDRIDNNRGYIKGNVRLVCLEFQHGRHQWYQDTWNEFCSFYKGRDEKIAEDEIAFIKERIREAQTTKAVRVRKLPVKPKQIGDNFQCTNCGVLKANAEFKQDNTRCKTCMEEYRKLREMTLNGRLRACLNSARNHTETRKKKKTSSKRTNLDFEITLANLYDIYRKQLGRCYYSGIVMDFYGPYLMSLERIDPMKGYTLNNSVLVCDIFNTGDFTPNSDNSSRGSSGWSQDKIIHAVNKSSENITPVRRTCFDVFKSSTHVPQITLTQLTIDSIIADFKKHNNMWCTDRERKTEEGLGMSNAIQNIRFGITSITDKQREQLLLEDPSFFEKKRHISSKHLSMTERVVRLVQYWDEYKKWPPNSYVLPCGLRLGLFKQNTRRNPPKSMSNDDRQKILKRDPLFFDQQHLPV